MWKLEVVEVEVVDEGEGREKKTQDGKEEENARERKSTRRKIIPRESAVCKAHPPGSFARRGGECRMDTTTRCGFLKVVVQPQVVAWFKKARTVSSQFTSHQPIQRRCGRGASSSSSRGSGSWPQDGPCSPLNENGWCPCQ